MFLSGFSVFCKSDLVYMSIPVFVSNMAVMLFCKLLDSRYCTIALGPDCMTVKMFASMWSFKKNCNPIALFVI